VSYIFVSNFTAGLFAFNHAAKRVESANLLRVIACIGLSLVRSDRSVIGDRQRWTYTARPIDYCRHETKVYGIDSLHCSINSTVHFRLAATNYDGALRITGVYRRRPDYLLIRQ